jgi:hypothetical protein
LKTTFYRNLKAFTLCAGFFSLVACKEKGVTKTGLIPDIDNIHTFGLTESFFTPTVIVDKVDSLLTSDSSYLLTGLGKISDDPFFGSTVSGLFIQFAPQSTFYNFPAGTIIDSATICLPYFNNITYGDTSKTDNYQYLKVFRVNDDNFKRVPGGKFFSSSNFTTLPTAIGSGNVPFKSLSDTFYSPVDTLGGQLRIRMSNDFVNEIATADSSKFNSTAAFLAFVKGFYIVPSDTLPAQKRISYFNLAGSTVNTSARIEFHTRTSAGKYSKVSFPFNSNTCAFSNRITRNYSTKPVISSFLNPTVPPANRDTVVIQGYPGFYSEITIKNIDQIPPSVINKARLLLTQIPVGDEKYYFCPPQIILEGVASNGLLYTIADLLTNGGSTSASGYAFVGGKPAKVTINGVEYMQYALNFPRELQVAINAGKKELKLRVSATTSYPGSYRMIAGGPNASDDTKIRLEVIYTKIN